MDTLLLFDSVWPYPLCLLILWGLASTPLFRSADAPPSASSASFGLTRPKRVYTLDGLRGFLALGVVIHHIMLYRVLLRTGEWKPSTVPFYENVGTFGVGMFFMITAFLFWGRIISDQQKPGKTDWKKLYTNRFFRIVPLYTVAALFLMALTLASDHFKLHESIRGFIKDTLRWLAFGFFSSYRFNNDPRAYLWLTGVTWTLQWEWCFYLSLPLLSFIAPFRRMWAGLPSGVLLLYVAYRAVVYAHTPAFVADHSEALSKGMFFVCGMITAGLHATGLRPRLPDWLSSTLVAVILFLCTCRIAAYTTAGVVFLGIGFYLLASGCTFFGVLTSRPARRLGDVSYGIYLLQGLTIALVFRPLHRFVLSTPLHFWECSLAALALTTIAGLGSYKFIELPWIDFGRSLDARRIASRPTATAPPVIEADPA